MSDNKTDKQSEGKTQVRVGLGEGGQGGGGGRNIMAHEK